MLNIIMRAEHSLTRSFPKHNTHMENAYMYTMSYTNYEPFKNVKLPSERTGFPAFIITHAYNAAEKLSFLQPLCRHAFYENMRISPTHYTQQ